MKKLKYKKILIIPNLRLDCMWNHRHGGHVWLRFLKIVSVGKNWKCNNSSEIIMKNDLKNYVQE